MIYLGEFQPGDSVFFAANFHSDQGTLVDPTSPAAQIRNPVGTWSDLTAPAKQNTKTGHYGGTVDTTSLTPGQYVIRMEGIVATSRNVATEFSFIIRYASKYPEGAVVADGSNTSTAFKTNLTSAVNDFWKDALILFVSGSLLGQVKKASAYDGTTKFITLSSAFTAAPSASDAFILVNR